MKKREIYLAGGCFWGVEAFFSRMIGILSTEVGYANGDGEETDYQRIKNTKHSETVYIVYDEEKISLKEVLNRYFTIIDPTSLNKQGGDVGLQYRTGIYYTDEQDVPVIEEVIKEKQKQVSKPIVVEVEGLKNYVRAEEYHQKYLEKHPGGYCHVDLSDIPGERPKIDVNDYTIMTEEEKEQKLTDLEYRVTQNSATEPPFQNEYHDLFEKGIYVDITSGEPLFLSEDKFESGCGWPAFSRPIEEGSIQYVEDNSFQMRRIEVRTKHSDSHLGHVFSDGPKELGGLRFCINSASLRFIPYDRMDEEGYGKWKVLF